MSSDFGLGSCGIGEPSIGPNWENQLLVTTSKQLRICREKGINPGNRRAFSEPFQDAAAGEIDGVGRNSRDCSDFRRRFTFDECNQKVRQVVSGKSVWITCSVRRSK